MTSVQLLPRFQQGPRSQQLLTVLLGDYWFARDEPIPSAALVELLGVFGVTASGARAAIQRLAHRGFLRSVKEGRSTSYGVSPMSRQQVNAHVMSLFSDAHLHGWDGTWTLVAYSLPDDEQGMRRMLREQLRRHRFGNLYDALWARPGEHIEELRGVRGEIIGLRPEHLTVFTGARLPDSISLRAVRTAYDLDDLAAGYRAFSASWRPLADRLRNGDQTPGDSEEEDLRVRTSIMTEWRLLRRSDPRLPMELLGADFPSHEARQVCSAVYDSLGGRAQSVVRRILASHDSLLAQHVDYHTFAASDALLNA
ncbi:PaaX family transcriptional regulator [Microbacterium sp. JB110]|uniref:PaaX family transcriptional regulator n=1 Tax=Microbacterium sp. JB110 TaxID=2024477 RepID=UPI00097F05C6|nr:PaaX family transcriptional regulator C-terminal domain-containing protein [Microbacterium sp. JB110]RCS62235.1 PaaX family transcriptional regulator [Microbacterium sp. JB110]SJM44402.1 Phenylacetic acid degradation operon negative regulatory protein PaaX [Frigoribacterium sp. JB110]